MVLLDLCSGLILCLWPFPGFACRHQAFSDSCTLVNMAGSLGIGDVHARSFPGSLHLQASRAIYGP